MPLRFKLDENLGRRLQSLLKSKSFDFHTVREESLEGCDDVRLFEVCCEEKRCLLTLDLDFADPFRFPPEKCGGIVVFRPPEPITPMILENMASRLLTALSSDPISGKLWIVEPNRIRIHLSREENE